MYGGAISAAFPYLSCLQDLFLPGQQNHGFRHLLAEDDNLAAVPLYRILQLHISLMVALDIITYGLYTAQAWHKILKSFPIPLRLAASEIFPEPFF